ncbi:hypothetical protein BHC44_05355 [Snodgrassella alvi]|nr:hypothetical protein BHC44_05355 [Snodgrassella alvi]
MWLVYIAVVYLLNSWPVGIKFIVAFGLVPEVFATEALMSFVSCLIHVAGVKKISFIVSMLEINSLFRAFGF